MRSATKRHTNILAAWPVVLSALLLLASCSGHRDRKVAPAREPGIISDASLLRIGTNNGLFIPVDIVNPWDTTQFMSRLALVPRDGGPVDISDRQVIYVPVKRSIVVSSVHVSALDSLGVLSSVRGVTDAMYIKSPGALGALRSGKIKDVGNSVSPSLESIIALQPDVILATPYENAGYGVLEQAGAVIIPCADYMENSPLGRAEWIKLLGVLYGCDQRANDWYAVTKARYQSLKKQVADEVAGASRPKVIKESVTNAVWYVPGGASYQARLIADAGGEYPWASDKSTGSLQLDFAAVYDKAADADIWLVSSYGHDMTLGELAADYPLNANIRAYTDGGVWSTDTSRAMLYEETPFSPQLLLREYVNIFHPGLLKGEDARLRYYRHVE